MKKLQINIPLAPLSGGIPKKPLTRVLEFVLLSVLFIGSAVFAAENIITPNNSEIISLSTNSGSTPLIVDFQPTNSDPDTSYKWEFSNGEIAYSRETTQIFSLPGKYSVVLTQTDIDGNSSSGSVLITALDEPNCEPDYDGDGFNNCDDLCPLVSGGTLNGGCPLLEKKCDGNCGCSDGYTCNFNGDQSTCSISGVCLPDKPKTSCYYDAEKNYLFGNVVCNSCPCKNTLEYNATIRMCDILFPAIVSQDGKEIYEKGGFFEVR